ncbi:Solute carrier family 2, facilitated glucose transporter member 1 [Aphelenchoides besseyi]|nr:Solute carrier family 2, facilitated glucose transporter member 1 [Aphelenchoides besseyi]KAI6195005.1 Solute carrier family 2, facilitated glucose transporter member 1 [Aphelenchoides besseyi]
MLNAWREARLLFICSLIALATNYPPAVINASVNTAVGEFRLFISESYEKRGIELSETTETIIRGAILNCWYVAQFIGAMTLPSWFEHLGRKREFFIAITGMALGSLFQLLACMSSLPELFCFGRFLAGLFSPLCDVAQIMYLQECTPTNQRGMFSFLAGCSYAFMICFGSVLGMNSVLGSSFVVLTAAQLCPVVLSIFLAAFIPDTPKFLMIEKDDRNAAMKSLTFFQGKKDENDEILDHFLLEAEKKAVAQPSQHEHHHLIHSATTRQLFTVPYLRFTMLIAVVEFIFMLPFFSILQSSTFFFEQTDIDLEVAELATTILFLLNFVAAVIGFVIIDRFPRRTLILGSALISTVALSVYIAFASQYQKVEWFKYASLGCIAVYILVYGSILGPLSLFISGELASQRYRSRVFSFSFGATNVLITITNWVSLFAFQKFGALAFIPLYILPYIFAITFLFFYLPETRGKEVYQVVDAIKQMVNRRAARK